MDEKINWYTPASVDIPPLPDNLKAIAEHEQVYNDCPAFFDLYGYTMEVASRSVPLFGVGATLNTLSTIAARRLKVEWATRGAYTDFYILNVAGSSRYAKSSVFDPQDFVMNELGLDYLRLPRRLTPSALFDEMTPLDLDKVEPEQYQEAKAKNAFIAQRGWVFGEIGKYISDMIEDKGTMGRWHEYMLEFRDYKPKISDRTVSHDIRHIKYGYLTLIGNATPRNFWNMSKNRLSGLFDDGFFARFWIATPPDDYEPQYALTTGKNRPPEKLITKLASWHNELGIPTGEHFPVHIIKPTKEVFDLITQYDKFNFYAGDDNNDWTSNYIRQVRKLLAAAALFASLNGSRFIGEGEFRLALQITEQYRLSMHRFIETIKNPVNQSKRKDTIDYILTRLHKHNEMGQLPISLKMLVNRAKKLQQLDPIELSELIESLITSQVIKQDEKGRIDLA